MEGVDWISGALVVASVEKDDFEREGIRMETSQTC